MKISRILMAVVFVAVSFSVYAYVPENIEENGFEERIIVPFSEVTDLVKDGIKAIRQEVVKSDYSNARGSEMRNGKLVEAEAGSEEVTSKEIVFYEPKEEIYEAREVMDEILIWLTMYRTTEGDDVLTLKQMKEYIETKSKYLDKLINALKYEKDNKDSVIKYKNKIKKADRDFNRYEKRLKGKILLIEGKPLPEPEDD